jgi:alpha-tubulin suppressor-like RCC1 family protein
VQCGRYHTVIVVETKTSKTASARKIYAFGLDLGIGVDGQESTHLPIEIKIPKLGIDNRDLKFVFTRYNTNVAVDVNARVFMWGENTSNLRLRKPKLFYSFPSSHRFKIEIEEIALGKRHGIIRTNEAYGGIYGWGDGTYGELGT